MTDLDRASLDRLLPHAAGSADWDDVLNRSGAQHRRRRLLFVLVAVGLALTAAASAFAVRELVFDKSFSGLPPEGAAPSAPKNGTLVISYGGRPEYIASTGHSPVKGVSVYADGRVIWRREGGPYGVHGVATGFLERRLTPEGVERLRSMVVATGLFDRDHYFLNTLGLPWPWGGIQVRNGGRLVRVYWCCDVGRLPPSFRGRATEPTKEQARAVTRLSALLARPGGWLPARAWANRKLSAYVPTKYAICFWRGRAPGYSRPLEPARILGSLPAAARRLLRGKDRTYDGDAVFSPLSTDAVSPSVTCSEVTTRDARALDDIFGRTGFERDLRPETAWLYRFRARDPIGATQISFEPILPHGQWEAMGG